MKPEKKSFLTPLKRFTRILVLLLVAVGIGGYVALSPLYHSPREEIHVQQTAPPQTLPDTPPASNTFVAGTGLRDITTPIGIPKFGYSAWAREADGFRTRLKARAFYFKSPGQPPVALVQTDLGAGSLLLRHKVAEIVSAQTDIPFANLSLLATHTHSGPAQYLSSDFYNAFASNKPGFDPEVFNFLARQISDAVLEAWQNQRPARMATGTIDIFGATRNRSLPAWVMNNTLSPDQANQSTAYSAINPTLTMIRIDLQTPDGNFSPAGALTSFSIHGTAIPPFTRPYHGDVWAFIEREVENRISRHYQPPWKPLHGAVEATHGDITPAWQGDLRGDMEARRIGLMIADKAWELFRQLDPVILENASLEPVIENAMKEYNLLDGQPHPPLCERAIVGTAVTAGATGDEVFPISYLPPFKEGYPRRHFLDSCQKEKRWIGGFLQPWILPAELFPHRLLVHAIRLHDTLLVALPFEITTESGRRIAQAIREVYYLESLNDPSLSVPATITLSSIANGYFGYATTAEEYSQQWYEGGHTLYGPGTQAWLAQASAGLVRRMIHDKQVADLPESWSVSLSSHPYVPEDTPVQGERRAISSPAFEEAVPPQEPFWRFEYQDANPSRLALHKPLISIQTRLPNQPWKPLLEDGIPVDDQGTNLQIRWLENSPDGMARYELRWYNPVMTHREQRFRFVLEPRDDLPVLYSPEFHY